MIWNPIKKMYCRLMKPICVWNIEDDWEALKKNIESDFIKCMKEPAKIEYKYLSSFRGGEEKYLFFLNECHMDVLFKKSFIEFFKKRISEILLDHIEKIFNRLECLLGE